MNLSSLSDDGLHLSAIHYASRDHENMIVVLRHLLEVQRRVLFSKYKCRSVAHYAEKILGYSADEAARRAGAMSMLEESPSVEARIERGELSLSHLMTAKSMFRKERKAGRALDLEKQDEVLDAMTGHSTRRAEEIVSTFTPEPMRTKVFTVRGAALSIDDEFARVKGLLAHRYPALNDGEMLSKVFATLEMLLSKEPANPKANSKAEENREVHRRAEHACENCGSTFALQRDHVVPRALGGEDSLENKRLLCRYCNQRAAIEKLGLSKMEKHLRRGGVSDHAVRYEVGWADSAAPRKVARGSRVPKLARLPWCEGAQPACSFDPHRGGAEIFRP